MNIFDNLTSFIIKTSVIVASLAFLSSLIYLLIKKIIDKTTFKIELSDYDTTPLNEQIEKEQHFKEIETNYVKKTIDLSGVINMGKYKN